MSFCAKKMKTSFCNIVYHSESNTFAQYRIIWTKYVMIVAITLVVWLKSHESSYMIALFWEHFKKNGNIQVCYFSLQLGHITCWNAKVLHFLIFLNFLCWF
jgi:hypothetical protein